MAETCPQYLIYETPKAKIFFLYIYIELQVFTAVFFGRIYLP